MPPGIHLGPSQKDKTSTRGKREYQQPSDLTVNEPIYIAVNKKWEIKNKTFAERKVY